MHLVRTLLTEAVPWHCGSLSQNCLNEIKSALPPHPPLQPQKIPNPPKTQQTRVYPYLLGAGSARPNPKMGAPGPENPLFLGFSVLRGGLRPWSRKGRDHGVGVDPETSKNEEFYGRGGFPAERTQKCQAPIRISSVISGPRIAGGKITGTRLFQILKFPDSRDFFPDSRGVTGPEASGDFFRLFSGFQAQSLDGRKRAF